MENPRKRKFIATVRVGKSTTEIEIETANEQAATGLLETLYGPENIIDVCAVGECDDPNRMSKAESDVSKAVTRNLWSAWGSVAKWMLRGVFRK